MPVGVRVRVSPAAPFFPSFSNHQIFSDLFFKLITSYSHCENLFYLSLFLFFDSRIHRLLCYNKRMRVNPAPVSQTVLFEELSGYGFDVPEWISFPIGAIPERLPKFPVALKIDSPRILHKSDVHAVILDLCSDDDVAEGCKTILEAMASRGITPDGQDRFVCMSMVRGIELFAGVADDPLFGRTLMFGRGGVLLELEKEICYLADDADAAEIARSIASLPIAPLFSGYRGMVPGMERIERFITLLQRFIADRPDIREMDLNPVMFDGQKLVIVDCRMRRGPAVSSGRKRRVRHDFFDNRRVAVVGATADPRKVGCAVMRNARASLCEILPLNPRGGMIEGRHVYRSPDEIEGTVDTAVIAVSADRVLPALEALVPRGLRNAVVISAGFKETGNDAAEQQLGEFAARHELNLLGPNSLGYYNGELGLNATFARSAVAPGDLALVSQSGAVLTALMDKGADSGVRFSHIVSVGNTADLTIADTVRMLERSPACRRIALYVEGIADGRDFLDALRSVTKPVIVFKAGRSATGKKAAFSHTGNLSGDYAMFRGLVRSVGVRTVETIEELLYMPPSQSGVAILTNAGGPAAILCDELMRRGIVLAELGGVTMAGLHRVLPPTWSKGNPVDIVGDAQSDRYAAALKILEGEPSVRTVVMIVTPQMMTDAEKIARLLPLPGRVRVIPVFLGGSAFDAAEGYCRERKILFFRTLREAADAV